MKRHNHGSVKLTLGTVTFVAGGNTTSIFSDSRVRTSVITFAVTGRLRTVRVGEAGQSLQLKGGHTFFVKSKSASVHTWATTIEDTGEKKKGREKEKLTLLESQDFTAELYPLVEQKSSKLEAQTQPKLYLIVIPQKVEIVPEREEHWSEYQPARGKVRASSV